jgi:uncharacterized protein
MRLSFVQQQFIREIVPQLLGDHCQVRVFGSRVNDQALGGDIDLWVSSNHILASRALVAARLVARLQLALGDQKIDLRLVDPASKWSSIDDVAMKEGVLL